MMRTGYLRDYQTGEYLRAATQRETNASIYASQRAPHTGTIHVDGRVCFVDGGLITSIPGDDLWDLS